MATVVELTEIVADLENRVDDFEARLEALTARVTGLDSGGPIPLTVPTDKAE